MNLNNYKDYAKVIIIDDNRKEGEAMWKALTKSEIPSLFYCIHETGDFPESPLKNVRLVFLDLILEELATPPPNDDAKAKHALANLKRFIGIGGAYILVIWTSKDGVDPVVNILKRLITDDVAIATPIKTVILNKGEYDVVEGGTANLNDIQAAITESLLDLPAFSVFSEGERLATNGIGKAISSIVYGKNNNELTKMVTALSKAYAGSHVNDEQQAKNALLALNGIFEDEITKEIAQQEFLPITSVEGLDSVEKYRLNTSLIFSQDRNGPGEIFELSSPELDLANFIKRPNTNGIKHIAVDITQLCDYSQNKNLYRTFILGVLAPLVDSSGDAIEPANEGGYFYQIDGKNGFGFLYKEEETEQERQIILNMRAIKTVVKDEIDQIGVSTEKTLRPNIVIDIQHKVASYISRPGHVLL
ncbi:MAG: hypothetical protein KAS07_00335 [Candidatus Pacebacteria bacterium]|nr:hypothetical protein [Candidatus Paceibacterota bacterium]